MQAEIVYSGLCSFLNVRNNHGNEMPEPSVILVRTDVKIDDDDVMPVSKSVKKANAQQNDGEGELLPPDERHIPYIAFDQKTTKVNDHKGFRVVDKAARFLFLELPIGVEIRIPTLEPGDPTIHSSYNRLAKKDEYWPEAKDQWNRDYVPVKGELPKKSAVVAYMRFGKGTISAARLCPAEWLFPKADGKERKRGRFAEEAIYSKFAHNGEVIVQLVDLEKPHNLIRELRFKPRSRKVRKLTVFIGNNDVRDMDNAVLRLAPASVNVRGDHFKFLNKVAAIKGGPVPKIINPPAVADPGGGSAGACGPHSSNG